MQVDWRGFTAKVSDFGLSKLMPDSLTHRPDSVAVDDVAGTVTHMAPELLSGSKATGAADVYAFGILSTSTDCDLLQNFLCNWQFCMLAALEQHA